jgi:hypothetical protein
LGIRRWKRNTTLRKKGKAMFITLSVLAALISGMFVASVASTITALKRENDDFRAMMERRKAF